jgi:ribosome modulation factor
MKNSNKFTKGITAYRSGKARNSCRLKNEEDKAEWLRGWDAGECWSVPKFCVWEEIKTCFLDQNGTSFSSGKMKLIFYSESVDEAIKKYEDTNGYWNRNGRIQIHIGIKHNEAIFIVSGKYDTTKKECPETDSTDRVLKLLKEKAASLNNSGVSNEIYKEKERGN